MTGSPDCMRSVTRVCDSNTSPQSAAMVAIEILRIAVKQCLYVFGRCFAPLPPPLSQVGVSIDVYQALQLPDHPDQQYQRSDVPPGEIV